jgi:hypothetical protein
LAQSRRQALTHALRKASFCVSASLFLGGVAKKSVLHAQRNFFTHMGLESLIEASLTAAALGGRGNAHGSTLVTPVPSVVGEMGLFPDGRIRRALALLDLAHRNLFTFIPPES